MRLVIDADSHWAVSWEYQLNKGPLRKFSKFFPREEDMLACLLAGDLLKTLPPNERPSSAQLFPIRTDGDGNATRIPAQFETNYIPSTVSERLNWMDGVGIDFAIVNGNGALSAFPFIPDLETRKAFLREGNDVLAAEIEGAHGRLGVVTYVDLADLDWAIAELTRMRGLGSRAVSIRAEPVNGMSLAHPHFDRLWSAVTDLGFIVNLHAGFAPPIFGEWGRFALSYDDPSMAAAFLRFAYSQPFQSVQLMLSAFLFGGVFARHPKLTILVTELFTYWVPDFVKWMNMLAQPSWLGPWPYPKSGETYIREQVRISPLKGIGDFMFNGACVFRDVPEMSVFSSDYPHIEGSADPINLCQAVLADFDPKLSESFLGGTMAEAFARTGDPLRLAAA